MADATRIRALAARLLAGTSETTRFWGGVMIEELLGEEPTHEPARHKPDQ